MARADDSSARRTHRVCPVSGDHGVLLAWDGTIHGELPGQESRSHGRPTARSRHRGGFTHRRGRGGPLHVGRGSRGAPDRVVGAAALVTRATGIAAASRWSPSGKFCAYLSSGRISRAQPKSVRDTHGLTGTKEGTVGTLFPSCSQFLDASSDLAGPHVSGRCL